MYAIAKYFTVAERRVAVKAEYTWSGRSEGYCPLGICIHESDPKSPLTAPNEYALACALGFPLRHPQHDAVIKAAVRFIKDWDNQRIRNLATALGVKV